MLVMFIVSVVLVVKIATRGVVIEAFVLAYTLVVVTVHVLEVDTATGNHSDFFWNGRYS